MNQTTLVDIVLGF